MEEQLHWTIEDELDWQTQQANTLREEVEHNTAITLALVNFMIKYKSRFTKQELSGLWLKIQEIEENPALYTTE